jgi:uncharacterized protein
MTGRWKGAVVALLAGLLFGMGLALSGMTQPRKVIAFLDFTGGWDPSLAFVMLAALAVHGLAYRFISGRTAPLFADQFAVPKLRRIDWKLLAGSAVFGIGWGLAGYCPGPAIVSLGSGRGQAIVFVSTLLLGMFAADTFMGFAKRKPSEL